MLLALTCKTFHTGCVIKYVYTTVFLACLFINIVPTFCAAQATLVPDELHIEKARVLDATEEQQAVIPGTSTPTPVQTLTAEVLEGPQKGSVVTFRNDYVQLEKGDTFFLRYEYDHANGTEYWTVADPYRLDVLGILTAVFLILLFVFGGVQGVRGLASLFGSFVLIMYVLLPGILGGYSPVLVSIGVSSLIIIIGSYITHGFNKTTTAAVFGMIATVLLTGAATYWVVHAGDLSGYADDESVYLNFNTHGGINLLGLLFGGIMIGLLGVLYDVAIGQAIAVEELFRAGTHMSRREVYTRGIRIGREHIGALVNTLAIAYVGVALPLLLLIKSSSTMSIPSLVNSELFATEIIRILVGSIGIILAVPITTLIASYMLSGYWNENKANTPQTRVSGHKH